MKNINEIIIAPLSLLLSIPARINGVHFGKKCFIGPGYDFLFIQMKNIFLGDNVNVGKNAWIQTIGNGVIVVGNRTSLGRNITISSKHKITIGNNCLFSFNTSLLDHYHQYKDIKIPIVDQGTSEGKEIKIADDCFIGAHTFIMPGVSLGKHVVVGANSVVTKSFPGYCVIAGTPAKVIKYLRKGKIK